MGIIRKPLLTLAAIALSYPLIMHFSSPNLYPTYSTQVPSQLKSGFYLVMNTRTQRVPENLAYTQSTSKTYVGPFLNIREAHNAYMKVKSIHPGIQTYLIKTDLPNQI
ncbi:hypothetical protein OAT84_01480 [Gammaproteobacteria bacterium]|nr:hypothetical protein [Gammaproteobacteria bacterium]